jgi:hypothetical protein
MSYSQNRTKHSSKEIEMPNAEKPKPKIKITGKATATGGGKNKPTLKLNQYGQPVKNVPSKSGTAKKSPSLASQAGKVVGKVAGAAKSKVKADIKAAKMVAGTVGKVATRAKTVAREARDIPTAVGTIARATADGKKGFRKEYAVAELKKQVKETTRAAKTGLKGSAAPQYGKGRGNR